MGVSVKAGLVALACALVALCATVSARADAFGPTERNRGKFGEAFDRGHHWIVGVTVDRVAGFTRLDDEGADDQLFGMSATWQRGWFGLHGKLLLTPQRRARRSRTDVVLGPRFLYTVFGHQWSYGFNVQGEAMLPDHRWVLYVSPVELGGDLYARGSFHVQLYVGVRYAAAGSLIKNMFIDPNGFPSEVFDERLDALLDEPWEGYVSLGFARTIE